MLSGSRFLLVDVTTFFFPTMVLSQEEIDGCREVFLTFDKDRSGSIDVWELKQVNSG